MTDHGTDPGRRRWLMRATTALVVAGSLTAVAADVAAAQAVPNSTPTLRVVKVVTRHPFGKMLATVRGRSLYFIPSNRCSGMCLGAWPPLLMPRHSKAIPTGISCLGTLAFGHRRQVTYRGHRLYTFVSDSGSSALGNGVSGFFVAKVRTGRCH